MKTGYWLTATIILLGVVILGMRQNNITVHNMSAELMERDRAGEDVRDEVEGELRDFAFSHMNADVSIVLEGAFERDQEAFREQVEAVDSTVYEEAVVECDREGQDAEANAACVAEFVEQRLDVATDSLQEPQIEAYAYTYVSPRWALDLPGIALALAIASGIGTIVSYTVNATRHVLKK